MEIIIIAAVIILIFYLFRRVKVLNQLRTNGHILSLFLMIGLMMVTIICGLKGFSAKDFQNISISDRNFYILQMFFLNYSDSVGNNIWLDIARYAAAFFTIGALAIILENAMDYLVLVITGLRRDSVLIFGDNNYARLVHDRVWPKGILTRDNYIPTRGKVLLLGTDDENNTFFANNYSRLRKKDVYFKTENLPGLMVQPTNQKGCSAGMVKYFSLEELAVHVYWQKYPLIPDSHTVEEAKRVLHTPQDFHVAIIGNHPLLDELILYGTQLNIYNEASTITYHIFGNNQRFEKLHKNLDQLHVVAHPQEWYEYQEHQLDFFDRVIVIEQQQQLKLIHELHLLSANVVIHAFLPLGSQDMNLARMLYLDDRGGNITRADAITLFPWIAEACDVNRIIDEEWMDAAMSMNYYYGHHNLDASKKDLISDWMKLGSYHKYSSMFSASYSMKYKDVALELVKDPECKEKLRRLEHIRWDNYSYFFNWKAPEGDEMLHAVQRDIQEAQQTHNAQALTALQPELDGTQPRQKDWRWRLHSDLIPFDELSQEDQDKDDFLNWLTLYLTKH